jgi:TRAP-type C4-dicarboxylate transport system permease small subunit
MAEADGRQGRPADRAGRILFDLTRWLAIFGGVVLCAIALLMTISITGRTLFQSPVRGYFELVGLGTGVAIFALLPFCQIMRENIVVDFFLSRAPARARSALDAVAYLLYGLIVTFLVWRSTVGGIDIEASGQKTTMLEIPLWTLFPWAVGCLVLLCIACFYTCWRSVREAGSGAAGERNAAR